MKVFRSQIANIITLSRIFFTIILLVDMKGYYFTADKSEIFYRILFWIVCICLSDFLDGKVARYFNAASDFGALLDMVADCFYTFSMFFVLWKWQYIPGWFLLLVIEKTVNYLVTSHMYQKKMQKKFAFIRDPVGRYISAGYFAIPAICIAAYHFLPNQCELVTVLLVCVGGLGILSSVMRWWKVKCVAVDKG